MYDVIIAGAGASGLMSAYLLGRAKLKVLVLDKNDQAGRKILATGNGKCNLTNLNYENFEELYRSGSLDRIKPILLKYTPEKIINLLNEIGLYTKQINNYVYPHNEQAYTVRNVLYDACIENGVEFLFSKTIDTIDIKTDKYIVWCNDNSQKFISKKLIIALGGKAYESLGATDTAYQIAMKYDIKVTNVFPSLVGLKVTDKLIKSLAGTRVKAKVSLFVDDDYRGESTGEIIHTNYGVSGIPIFQISRFAAQAINDNNNMHNKDISKLEKKYKKIQLHINYLLDFNFYDIKYYFKRSATLRKAMRAFLNEDLTDMIIQKNCDLADVPLYNIDDKMIDKIAKDVHDYTCNVIETNGFENAQVTAGGIDIRELNSELMSIYNEGLYFAGECLDVDGICGGYNIHWAFASAIHVANNIVETYVDTERLR